MKILFVDDNELNRMVTEDMIAIIFPGAVVESYESAKAALNEADIESFDLIFSDIDMPVMDGFMFHDALRNECNYQKPIIALTALAISGDKERMLMHGFTDYVSKPIDLDELERILKKYLPDA